MSIKSADKFDFILATFKISPIYFLMFLELLSVMVWRATWLHVQKRLTCLYSGPQWRVWMTSWPTKSCEITDLDQRFLLTLNASVIFLSLPRFSSSPAISCSSFSSSSLDILHIYSDWVCHLWQPCNDIDAEIMIWLSRRRRFHFWCLVWEETLWKEYTQFLEWYLR